MGFSYKDWLGNFYPQFCPPADFLQFYASQFNTVEIDSTFYRIPTEQMIAKWDKITPDSFVMAAKFPQTVTHEGDITSRIETAHAFIEVMKGLNAKLGPLLLQFPYSFKPDQKPLLTELIATLPTDIRIAIELRNKNWLGDELYDMLRERNIALCLVDHPWVPKLAVKTADFHYIRLLGDRKLIESDFSYVRYDRKEELMWWRQVISDFTAAGGDLFVFINNHYSGHAPTTARRLIDLLSK